jgi:hypothetical protein
MQSNEQHLSFDQRSIQKSRISKHQQNFSTFATPTLKMT